MPEPPSVLLFGQDPHLTETRSLLLSRAGFKIRTVNDLSDFARECDLIEPDVVILCHTLSLDECTYALALTDVRWPRARRLVLTAGTKPLPEGARDDAMEVWDGPAQFVAQVAHLARTPTHSYTQAS